MRRSTSCILSLVIAFSLGALADYLGLAPRRLLQIVEYASFGMPLVKTSAWLDKKRLFDPNFSDARIVMLGDSLTAYGNWNLLLRRLDVINYGVEGDTVAGLLERVDAGGIENKTVVLMIGINDIMNHGRVEGINSKLAEVVDKLARDNAVILQSTLLTRSPKLNARVRELNLLERQICDAHKCKFLDVNSVLMEGSVLPASLSIDEVHVNLKAYKAWANALTPLVAH